MLKSISARYDPVEDRLVLVIDGQQDGQPVVRTLHLTRRVCEGWRKQLGALAEFTANPPQSLESGVRAEMASMHHASMAGRASLRREALAPLPSTGQVDLVKGVRVGRKGPDQWRLSFEIVNSERVALTLSEASMHGLMRVLTNSVNKAEWALPTLNYEVPVVPGSGSGPVH